MKRHVRLSLIAIGSTAVCLSGWATLHAFHDHDDRRSWLNETSQRQSEAPADELVSSDAPAEFFRNPPSHSVAKKDGCSTCGSKGKTEPRLSDHWWYRVTGFDEHALFGVGQDSLNVAAAGSSPFVVGDHGIITGKSGPELWDRNGYWKWDAASGLTIDWGLGKDAPAYWAETTVRLDALLRVLRQPEADQAGLLAGLNLACVFDDGRSRYYLNPATAPQGGDKPIDVGIIRYESGRAVTAKYIMAERQSGEAQRAARCVLLFHE